MKKLTCMIGADAYKLLFQKQNIREMVLWSIQWDDLWTELNDYLRDTFNTEYVARSTDERVKKHGVPPRDVTGRVVDSFKRMRKKEPETILKYIKYSEDDVRLNVERTTQSLEELQKFAGIEYDLPCTFDAVKYLEDVKAFN